jgi:hypothetical protein
MSTDKVKTSSVCITLSDPWDLGESLGWKPLFGTLVKADADLDGGRALVRFNKTINYRGTSYQYAVAAPRYKGDSLKVVDEGGKVYCSFTGVSDEHASLDDALSTQHWRGGLAFIGDLEALAQPGAQSNTLP